MKSTLKLASAVLLMASSAAFAAPQTAAHPSPQPVAQAAAQSPAPATKAGVKAEKQQIRREEKTALASCKGMKGAAKSDCKKEAIAKASTARAHMKASKHA